MRSEQEIHEAIETISSLVYADGLTEEEWHALILGAPRMSYVGVGISPLVSKKC